MTIANSKNTEITYTVFNTLSQQITQGNNTHIDLTAASPGIYFIHIKEDNNQQVYKVIKK